MGRLGKILGAISAVLAVLAFVLFLVAPLLVRLLLPTRLGIDLGALSPVLSNQQAVVQLSVTRSNWSTTVIAGDGEIGPVPCSADIEVNYNWPWQRPWISATAFLRLADAEGWRVGTHVAVDSPSRWRANVSLARHAFSESDPVVDWLASAFVTNDLRSTLRLGGIVSAEAVVESKPPERNVSWEAALHLSDFAFAARFGQTDVGVDGLRLHAQASGQGRRLELVPIRPTAARVTAAGFTLTNVFANVCKVGNSYLVTEAGAGFCRGDLRLYSLFLDPERLNAGVTLFLDNVDAGDALAHLHGFHGTASGRLHGKIPLRLVNNREFRLGRSYLFSTPGEIGQIRLTDATPVLENLARTGVTGETAENLGKALRNLDYKVLRLELSQASNGISALTLRVEGTSTAGSTTVPVTFQATFRGDIEQLLNTGFQTSRLGK